MSLDIWLTIKKPACECCGRQAEEIEVFETNITHNLIQMAGKAGIYDYVWTPDVIGIKKAGDLIYPLEKGISDMKARPGFYKKFDSSNGWGTYDQFLPWLEEYLQACKNYPEAEIGISR